MGHRRTGGGTILDICLILGTAIWGLTGWSSGRASDDFSRELEGHFVTVRIEMPATKDGVDVYPERDQPIDYREYAERLKEHGIALRPGDRILITKVKAKDKHIELQLGGGGYGTAGDESAWVSTPSVPKSEREKQLEKLVKQERDKSRRKALERERASLADQREREERRLRAIAERTRIEKEARIRELRLQAGSRFNVRYDHGLTPGERTAESLMAALSDYLDFSSAGPDAALETSDSFSIRKGLLWQEVLDHYGEPDAVSKRDEGSLTVTSCSYEQGDEVLRLEFVEGVLIRYSIESK
jgi:hypothetical protein